VVNQHLCTAINKIQAFPTMRLFKNGEPVSPDYRGDRTVEALVEFAASHVAREEQLAQLPADERRVKINEGVVVIRQELIILRIINCKCMLAI
jgi:thioredoxin-like negative regulator of GroEL